MSALSLLKEIIERVREFSLLKKYTMKNSKKSASCMKCILKCSGMYVWFFCTCTKGEERQKGRKETEKRNGKLIKMLIIGKSE